MLSLDKIAVKGKKEGVRIYTILSDVGLASHGGSAKHHNTFLTLYRAQRWDDALKLLELNKITYPELCGYYEMMEDRIDHLKEDEPG